MFRQYLWEDFKDKSFDNITAYKQYFGAQKGMRKAFFDFKTVWMILLAPFALAVTIY